MKNYHKKLLTSDKLLLQVIGAIIKLWRLVLLLLAIALPILYDMAIKHDIISAGHTAISRGVLLLSSICVLIVVISVCNNLSDIFNLLRQEKNITNSQIAILCAIGIWIVSVIFILHIEKDSTAFIAFGVIGSVLTWILQDRVKGAVAFIHFRRHGLLKIGDWIQIPKLNVNGEIRKVTLTSITLYNWDTTTSTIPTSSLQSEHFINLQNMCEGKTYGRRMLKTFTIDTGWIHALDEKEVAILQSNPQVVAYLPEEDLKAGAVNMQLYRLYLYHWLMDNPHVSQQPRMIVRWKEHKDSGMELEIYAFIIDSDLPTFEWRQSQIIEHVVESMSWFGLRLYQSPSAFDASNSNIYMSAAPATYKMENAI